MGINEPVEDEVSKALLSSYFNCGSLKYKQTKPNFGKAQNTGSLSVSSSTPYTCVCQSSYPVDISKCRGQCWDGILNPPHYYDFKNTPFCLVCVFVCYMCECGSIHATDHVWGQRTAWRSRSLLPHTGGSERKSSRWSQSAWTSELWLPGFQDKLSLSLSESRPWHFG